MAVERIQHGINGPEPPLFSRPTDPQTTPFKYMRDAATNHNKTRILKATGPYIAEVIRVFKQYEMPSDDKTIPLGYWDQFEDGAEGTLIVLRVRIPEIDTFGVPGRLPVNDEDFKNLTDRDRHLVERYPKCIGKWLNMKLPVAGQAVWVDFRDPKNRAERMYLGIVNETQMAGLPGAGVDGRDASERESGEAGGARDSFNKAKALDIIASYKVIKDVSSVDSSIQLIAPNTPYLEQRVRAGAFASLPGDSPLLKKIPGGAKVHTLFADRLAKLNSAWINQGGGSEPFSSSNGLRARPEVRYAWLKNPNSNKFQKFAKNNNNANNLKAALQRGETNHYKLWEAMLLDEYNNLRLGKERRGWNSPHQTGLAVDFNNNGLTPMTKEKSIPTQQASKSFQWLRQNAYKFGINPYKKEPWHWECLIPRENFISGEEFSPHSFWDQDRYNIKVIEKSTTGKKLATTHKYFAANKFA